jgi:hypothetical protein
MKRSILALSLALIGFGISAQTPRLSLYEEFTGETCPPCAATNPGLNATLLSATNATKIVAIKWQVPIPSAPSNTWSLYKTNQAEIDWRYKAPSAGYGYASQNNASSAITSQGVNSAPSGRIDGQHQWVFGATSDHPTYMSNAIITTAQSYTSAFSITMTRAWNKTCSAVNLTVNIQATASFTSSGNLVFRTVMVERLIQFSVQPGTNGETTFEDVAIKSFPSIQSGVSMASNWTIGQTQTFTLSCPIPSYTRKKEEIAFVGFIQDDGNKKVAQACRADKVPLPADALAGIAAQVDLTCSSNMITPTVVVKNDGTVNAITALTLTPYIDGIQGSPTNWTGNLAIGSSATVVLNPITTPVISGAHTFTCDVDMLSPVYNLTKNAMKTNYMVVGNYQGTPVAEGFVSTTYPPTGWGVINPDLGPTWSRSGITGGFNLTTESTKYDFFNNTNIGDKDELYLPPVNLLGSTNPILTFDLAYAQRTNTSNDQLEVLVSDDCGANWTSFYYTAGTAMSTAGSPVTNAYVPDPLNPTHWRNEFVTLTGFNKPNVLVKFVVTSDHGNNLYLDNINLSQQSTVGIRNDGAKENILMYPNPTNGVVNIKMNTSNAGMSMITVLNNIGQIVYTGEVTLNAGSNITQVNLKGLPYGIYMVNITTGNSTTHRKINLTNQ